MRNFILLLACATLASVSVCTLTSCTFFREPDSQIISYIGDNTEKDFKHLDLEALQQISVIHSLADGKDNGASETFRISGISEISITPVQEINIEAVHNRWFSNDLERSDHINQYWSSINTALSNLNGKNEDRIGSAIFAVIAREVETLRTSPAHKKVLIINSDLVERSSLANFYNPKQLTELTKSEKMLNRFKDRYPLGDMEGITVFIIYQPTTIQDAERFELIASFYTKLLSGAQVIVSASLPRTLQ